MAGEGWVAVAPALPERAPGVHIPTNYVDAASFVGISILHMQFPANRER